MEGFYINALSHVFYLALRNDGVKLEEKEIEKCIRNSAAKNNTALHNDEFITNEVMFLIYVDMTDEIGRALGHSTDKEGFALDWAEKYPSFQHACLGVRSSVLEVAAGLDEEVDPVIAAVQLEIERHNPAFH